MIDFWQAIFKFEFLRNALFAGLLASIACGVTGSFVVVRRISYLAGAIAHCVLGGMGAARYFQVVHGWSWANPVWGAVAAALVAAAIIGWVGLRSQQREDTVIGAVWAVGMAAGILFISQTPGYNEDLMSYLFGNILMVSGRNLMLMAVLDAMVLAVVFLFYHRFVAVCFDDEFARLRGINVEAIYLLLLILTALTVVLLVMVVGIVMVIALLTLPVAAAGRFTATLHRMMILAVLLSMVLTTLGLNISYAWDLPSGATIILLAGAVYLLVVIAGGLAERRLHRRWVQRHLSETDTAGERR